MHNLQVTLTMQVDNDIYSALLNQQQGSLSVSTVLVYVLENRPELIQVRSLAKVIDGCK